MPRVPLPFAAALAGVSEEVTEQASVSVNYGGVEYDHKISSNFHRLTSNEEEKSFDNTP